MKTGDKVRLLGRFVPATLISEVPGNTVQGPFGNCFNYITDTGDEGWIYEYSTVPYTGVYEELKEKWKWGQENGYQFMNLFLNREEGTYHISLHKTIQAHRNKFHNSLSVPHYKWIGSWPDTYIAEPLE